MQIKTIRDNFCIVLRVLLSSIYKCIARKSPYIGATINYMYSISTDIEKKILHVNLVQLCRMQYTVNSVSLPRTPTKCSCDCCHIGGVPITSSLYYVQQLPWIQLCKPLNILKNRNSNKSFLHYTNINQPWLSLYNVMFPRHFTRSSKNLSTQFSDGLARRN